MEEPYRTLRRSERVEIDKIKGSRFIAAGFPFSGELPLRAKIDALRREFSDANHHCYGWRDGERFRYSDDGEPSGSAGKPILQQIDGHDLDRVAIVVTRFFGGTKLGVGGLIRAYGAAARELLDRAEIIDVIPFRHVTVTIPYELSPRLAAVVAAFGLEAEESAFGAEIRQSFRVTLTRVDAFVAELNERTAGRAEIAIVTEER